MNAITYSSDFSSCARLASYSGCIPLSLLYLCLVLMGGCIQPEFLANAWTIPTVSQLMSNHRVLPLSAFTCNQALQAPIFPSFYQPLRIGNCILLASLGGYDPVGGTSLIAQKTRWHGRYADCSRYENFSQRPNASCRFIMLKMFLAASITSTLSFSLLSLLAPQKFQHARKIFFGCGETKSIKAAAVGGALLGAGMAIGGACPGMVIVQLGANVQNAGWTFAGALLGAAFYGVFEPMSESLSFPHDFLFVMRGFLVSAKTSVLSRDEHLSITRLQSKELSDSSRFLDETNSAHDRQKTGLSIFLTVSHRMRTESAVKKESEIV